MHFPKLTLAFHQKLNRNLIPETERMQHKFRNCMLHDFLDFSQRHKALLNAMP